MERISTGRPMAAVISLTAAGVITLTATTTLPAQAHLPGLQAPRVSTQAVRLTASPLEDIWNIATGQDPAYPLPAGTNPVAPIAEQAIRSVVTYGGQLLTGKGNLIPGEVSTQAARLRTAFTTANNLIAEDIAIVPVVMVSLVFNTALGIAGLMSGADTLPFLATVWTNAAILPPLKWTYNAFAIRNTIAVALQVPSEQPAPAMSVQTISPEPATARVEPKPTGTATSLRTRGTTRGVAGPARPNRKASPAAAQSSARAAAATGEATPSNPGRPAHNRTTGVSARTRTAS